MKLAEHSTVKQVRSQQPTTRKQEGPLDADWLRQLVLDAGADDVGFVEMERAELDDQRNDILGAFPRTQALVTFVVCLNREPIRTPARSLANLEFGSSWVASLTGPRKSPTAGIALIIANE